MQPRIESLFSGIGGLDLAVERVFDARVLAIRFLVPQLLRALTPR